MIPTWFLFTINWCYSHCLDPSQQPLPSQVTHLGTLRPSYATKPGEWRNPAGGPKGRKCAAKCGFLSFKDGSGSRFHDFFHKIWGWTSTNLSQFGVNRRGTRGFDPYSDLKISAVVRCCQREPSSCLSGMLMALSRAIGCSKNPLVLLNTPNYGYNLVKFRIHPIILNLDRKFRIHPNSKQTAVKLDESGDVSIILCVNIQRE